MKKQYTLKVDEKSVNKRLDIFISECTELTRAEIKKYADIVKVNDKDEKMSYKCRLNDTVDFSIQKSELSFEPEDIPLNIVYEDQNYIVVNKESGMVVHPAKGNYSQTLVNALLGLKKELSLTEDEFRPGIVHRLDKDTSGLIIVAKNNQAHNYLTGLFQDHDIDKRYYAIVKGRWKYDKLTIENNIGRSKSNRKKMSVLETGGKKAVSHIEPLEIYEHYSVLSIKIETGRTHQIRVHLSDKNYPILGDTVYSRKDSSFKDIKMCLCSYKLSFYDKFSSRILDFTIDMPDFMKDASKKISII